MPRKHQVAKIEKVHRTSGNVFADLRIPNPEQYLAKAELAAKILRIVERRGLTQAATGKLLGINQPKVSALLNGRLDGFSSDRLFRFLNALGCDVRITVSRPHPKNPGRVQVMAS
jgi:predicted XRE-type DNA-binding protein